MVGRGAREGAGVAAVVSAGSAASDVERTRGIPRAVGWTLAAFVASSVLFSGAFPPFANPNELSRYESVVAAWDRGTFAIDEVIPTLGDHEDKSVSGGKTYSNKAPGLAFAALPVYALLRIALPPPSSAAAPILWILRILTVTLVCAVALARLAKRLAAGPAPQTAPLVVAAVALGTPYLFFARSFFAHAWTAALLFLSWDALVASEGVSGAVDGDGRPRGGSGRAALFAALAGFLAGWGAISEYTVAPVAGLLALRAVFGPDRRKIRRLLAFAVGAAIPLAKLAFYDAMCFGSPWVLSSAREAYPSYGRLAGSGLFGFGVPSPRVAVDYLFHPARGLVLFSPFLIWAVPGFVRWWRSKDSRADCVFALAATAVLFVLMCGYPNWHGGWSLGNRYLVPVLFFPALAIPHALETPRSRGFFGAAVVLSAATHLLLTASWPYFPDNVPWPAATGSGWFLARGWTAPSLLDALPGGGWAALAMTWAAGAVAIALALGAAGAARAAGSETPVPGPPMGAVALLGLVPLLALVAFAPELDFGGRLWRASVFGAYSGRDPERRELREVAQSAATPQQQRMATGAWRVYGPRSDAAP